MKLRVRRPQRQLMRKSARVKASIAVRIWCASGGIRRSNCFRAEVCGHCSGRISSEGPGHRPTMCHHETQVAWPALPSYAGVLDDLQGRVPVNSAQRHGQAIAIRQRPPVPLSPTAAAIEGMERIHRHDQSLLANRTGLMPRRRTCRPRLRGALRPCRAPGGVHRFGRSSRRSAEQTILCTCPLR